MADEIPRVSWVLIGAGIVAVLLPLTLAFFSGIAFNHGPNANYLARVAWFAVTIGGQFSMFVGAALVAVGMLLVHISVAANGPAR